LAEASGTITLGNASNGSSVTVTQGTKVVVDLKGSVGTGTEFLWSLPTTSQPSVLSLRSESERGAETRAVYVAAQTGSTTITSDEACRVTAQGHACPLFILLWRVGVTVTR
jgi:predicted secreted protein